MTTPILFREYIWLVNTIYKAKDFYFAFVITKMKKNLDNTRKRSIFASKIQR